jgi:hypothetical protein
MTKLPNPGSNEAIARGCSCPVLDNGHGRGSMWGPNTFIYTQSCTLHTIRKDMDAPGPDLKR